MIEFIGLIELSDSILPVIYINMLSTFINIRKSVNHCWI